MPGSSSGHDAGAAAGTAAAPPFLFDGPPAGPTLLLAHGAGAPMDSPFMQEIAARLGAAGLRVARFEFPYMRERRTSGARKPPDREPRLRETWLAAIGALAPIGAIAAAADGAAGAPGRAAPAPGGRSGASRLFIGGKSLGGRMASLVADEAGVRGLVCLGYPFLPPGSNRPPRTAHLAALRTPSLIVQGTRDPFGGREAVAGYTLAPGIRVHWIEDGDHSLVPRRSSGRTEEQNLAEAVDAVAAFVFSLDSLDAM